MEKKEITLKDFIEDNSKLITALGVFVALTIYSVNSNFSYGKSLSFIFIFQSILIWYEIYKNTPTNISPFSLIGLFQEAFIFPITFFIVDSMIKYNPDDTLKTKVILFFFIVVLWVTPLTIHALKEKQLKKK